MAALQALCVWGQLDGQWIAADTGQFTVGHDLYRFRWWEFGGRQLPVYIKAGRVDGQPLEQHPDTKDRIRAAFTAALTT